MSCAIVEDKMFIVYEHVSPSGKRYIGITSQKPERRWKNGKGYEHNPAFYKAIQKYGWSNFLHNILKTGLTKDQAEDMEINLIKEYKTTDKRFGYNIENGGNCSGTHSEETRRKIGLAKKGNKDCCGRKLSAWHIEQLRCANLGNTYMLGKTLSEDAKRKISLANKGKYVSEETKKKISQNHAGMSGENNPMYGKHQSDETKKKISDKAKGRKMSFEARKRMSDSAHKQAVFQTDLNENILARFETCKDAANSVNGNSQNIGFACRNPQRTYKGYRWRYAE